MTLDAKPPMNRRRVLQAAGRAVAAVGAAVWTRQLQAAGAEPLVVALVPYLSPRSMLAQFDPLRRHLAGTLNRPVEFYTASSFPALLDSVRERRQPLTLLPMHLARIAVADWGHTWVVRSTRESPVHLLAPRSLGLADPQALRGRRIGAIDPVSVTSLMLRRWLRLQRLDGEVTVVHLPNASAMALALARGEVDGMAAAQGQALDVPWMRPDELVTLAVLGTVLTPGFVALRDTPAADVAAWRSALLRFETPDGRSGASGAQFAEGHPRDLEPYETFAAEARRLLAAEPPAPRPAR